MRRFVATFLVFAGVVMLVTMMASAESDMSRLNRERKAIGRALLEMQSGDWPSLLHNYTEDIEYHDPIVTIYGIDMMAQFLGRLFGSTPNLVTTVEDEICINGIYAATWTMDGFFNGVPYSAGGMTIIKFLPKSTKVYYQRDYYTEGDIMINIPGLDEPTAAFRTYYRCAVDPSFDCPLEVANSGAVFLGEATMKEDSPAPGMLAVGMGGARSDMSHIDRE
ncbi:MAG: nuclear transport factor 2 family protein, partial [bacterium]